MPALPRTAGLTSALVLRRNLICVSFSRGFSAVLDSLFPKVAFSNEQDSVVAPQERGPALKPRGSSFPVFLLLTAPLPCKRSRVCASKWWALDVLERPQNAPASWCSACAPCQRGAGSRLGLRGVCCLLEVPLIIWEKSAGRLSLCHLPLVWPLKWPFSVIFLRPHSAVLLGC